VTAEHRFLNAVAAGAFDLSAPVPPKTPSDVVSWYSAAFAADVEKLQTLTGEQLLKPIDSRGLFTLPAHAFLLSGLSHTIHHRGPRAPAIYGESYDSRQARP